MPPRVTEIKTAHGFDNTGATPWQMVPLGGSRPIGLLDAPNLDISFSDRRTGLSAGNAITFDEPNASVRRASPSREIWLQGRKEGAYEMLLAGKPGFPMTKVLEIDVVALREVKLMFYFLPGTDRSWNAEKLTSDATAILFNPANVRLTFMGAYPKAGDPEYPVHLPQAVDLDNQAHVTELRDNVGSYDAGVSVYFVHDIAGGTATEIVSGLSRLMRVLLNTRQRTPGTHDSRMARTLAHEIGHIFSSVGRSHDDRATDLMFGHVGAQTGLGLRRERILRLHGGP